VSRCEWVNQGLAVGRGGGGNNKENEGWSACLCVVSAILVDKMSSEGLRGDASRVANILLHP